MVTIRRETDYACRVILHLAMLPENTRVTAQDIAKRRLVPKALIRRVITRLGAAHLLTTTRGNGGGLSLSKSPGEISLFDVVQAMEGPLALNGCVVNPKECPLMRVCSVHEAWCKAHAVLVAELSQSTFDKLAARGEILGT
jgi:Rrf2 family protein